MSRLRLPAAAGFILVGVALGPSGLGLIAHLGIDRDPGRSGRADAAVHHRHGNAAAILPQIAAAGAGRHRSSPSLVIAVSVALFTVIVHGEVLGGVVIGFMLSISSTAVAMKMIEDAEEKNTPAGRLARRHPGGAGPGGGAAAADHQRAGRGADGEGAVRHRAGGWRWRWALLVGFIALLTRIKSFRFPGRRISAQEFRCRHPGRAGHLLCRARRCRACWACRRRWAPSWAGWRWAIPPCGAAPDHGRSRCSASCCSSSSCRWAF